MSIVAVQFAGKYTVQLLLLGKPVQRPSDEEKFQQAGFVQHPSATDAFHV